MLPQVTSDDRATACVQVTIYRRRSTRLYGYLIRFVSTNESLGLGGYPKLKKMVEQICGDVRRAAGAKKVVDSLILYNNSGPLRPVSDSIALEPASIDQVKDALSREVPTPDHYC